MIYWLSDVLFTVVFFVLVVVFIVTFAAQEVFKDIYYYSDNRSVSELRGI